LSGTGASGNFERRRGEDTISLSLEVEFAMRNLRSSGRTQINLSSVCRSVGLSVSLEGPVCIGGVVNVEMSVCIDAICGVVTNFGGDFYTN